MFKTTILIILFVFVLPTDPRQQQQLNSIAGATAHNLYTFCDRHGDTCETGSYYLQAVRKHAGRGIQSALRMINEGLSGDAASPQRDLQSRRAQGTLNTVDFEPFWRVGDNMNEPGY